MKKTVIALAIAAMAATSANAVTVYDKDGTKVDLKGSLRIFLGKNGDNQRTDLTNDGSRLYINAAHKLNDDVTGFVGTQFRFEGEDTASAQKQTTDTNFGGIQTRDLFGGFAFKDVGAVSFGRQATTADDVLGDSLYHGSADLNKVVTKHADKSIKFKSAEFGGFSVGVDYLFGHSDKQGREDVNGTLMNPGTHTYKNGYGVTGFYNYEFGEGHNIDAALTYGEDNYDAGTSDTHSKSRNWLFATHYNLADLHLGAGYGQRHVAFKKTADEVKNTKAKYVFLESTYNLKGLTGVPATFGLQWERLSTKEVNVIGAASKIQNHYIAEVQYELSKNIIPFVNYGYQTEKTKTKRNGESVYGVGLRVNF